jgi:hypothetical protein
MELIWRDEVTEKWRKFYEVELYKLSVLVWEYCSADILKEVEASDKVACVGKMGIAYRV